MAAKMPISAHLSLFNFALLCFFIQTSLSAPIEPIYANFVRNMTTNRCSSPEQIKLPLDLSSTTNETNPDSLSSHLTLCQNLETVQHAKEAHYLCQEIFDNLKVILCPPISAKVLAANLTLSKDVCKDIESMKEVVPEDKVILKRLTDIITCELMCDGVFESACKVLLWSQQLQQSENIEKPKEAKENSLQAGLEAVEDNAITDDQNKANQVEPKITASEQKALITESTKDQSSNDLVSTIQKKGTTVKQEQQNQNPEQQDKPEPNAQKPPEIQPNQQDTSNKLPLNENKYNASTNAEQGQEIKNNELPEQSQEIKNNKLPEQGQEVKNNELTEQGQEVELPNADHQGQQDPHDQDEDLPVKVDENALEANISPAKAPDNMLPGIHAVSELSNLPEAESPDQKAKDETNAQVPQRPVDDGQDPHDGEEVGDETGEDNQSNVSHGTEEHKTEEDKSNKVEQPRTEMEKQGQDNKVGQAKTTEAKTTLDKATTTKQQSSDSTTKKVTPTSNKETSQDDKILPAVETKSTLGQKSAESESPKKSSSPDPTTAKDSAASKAIQEKMEGEDDVHENPEDREPDPYTDLENTEGDPDDEYARQEYDNGMYEKKVSPIKPIEEEMPKVDVMRPREPSYNDFSPRNTYNRQPEVLPVFPDQEDGHFFFYFLSIVLILMGGYLLFHNKQKIIALIVEGRHERRRRSHGVGYKKLETK